MLTGGFQDIGIVKADNLDFTIIKELASRLARIINSTMGTYQHNYLHHAIANNSYRQQHLCNGRVMKGDINLPRFALAKQQLTVLRPAKQRNWSFPAMPRRVQPNEWAD